MSRPCARAAAPAAAAAMARLAAVNATARPALRNHGVKSPAGRNQLQQTTSTPCAITNTTAPITKLRTRNMLGLLHQSPAVPVDAAVQEAVDRPRVAIRARPA